MDNKKRVLISRQGDSLVLHKGHCHYQERSKHFLLLVLSIKRETETEK
jgi:hypothetical protein